MLTLPSHRGAVWALLCLGAVACSPNDDAVPCPSCGDHGVCQEASGACACEAAYEGAQCERCADGYVRDGDACLPGSCVVSADCSDGDFCNGTETCVDHACVSGAAIECGPHGTCQAGNGLCGCAIGWTGTGCTACGPGYLAVDGDCVKGECSSNEACSDGDPCNGEETCGQDHQCRSGAPVDCGTNGTCSAGACSCDPGYEGVACDTCAEGYLEVQGQCLPGTCATDLACSDGKVCNGQETCSAEHTCAVGAPLACGSNAHCEEPSGACVCDAGNELKGGVCEPITCSVPQAPTLSIVHAGATLTWSAPGQPLLQVGTGGANALVPDAWLDASSVTLPTAAGPYERTAFARVNDPSCASAPLFSFTYRVHEHYPSAAGEADTEAVAMDDARIVGWATGWVDPIAYGSDLDDVWKTPERAVGPAEGTTGEVVSLGRGGSIVMTFDPPIADGPGMDLAVFENGFIDTFLELAYVEVSSNGTDFIRFDSAYLGSGAVGGFSGHEAHEIGSLAGKYRHGYGTPFDLSVFANRPEVRAGVVDLSAIRYVRVVDIVGDGSALDSFGHAIFDPYPTVGSAGFDLDAIAALNID